MSATTGAADAEILPLIYFKKAIPWLVLLLAIFLSITMDPLRYLAYVAPWVVPVLLTMIASNTVGRSV